MDIKDSVRSALDIEGCLGSAIVDYETGLCLGGDVLASGWAVDPDLPEGQRDLVVLREVGSEGSLTPIREATTVEGARGVEVDHCGGA